MKNKILALLVMGSLFSFSAIAGSATPKVFFKNLKEGAKIENGFKVEFGVSGMKIAPAGKPTKGTGHFHLIVDGAALPAGQVIPADATHLHFGKGQTSTEITGLTPGVHSLTLQFADGAHMSYGEGMSSTVRVDVRK